MTSDGLRRKPSLVIGAQQRQQEIFSWRVAGVLGNDTAAKWFTLPDFEYVCPNAGDAFLDEAFVRSQYRPLCYMLRDANLHNLTSSVGRRRSIFVVTRT